MTNLVYERSHETDFQISQAINKYPVPSRGENSSERSSAQSWCEVA